MCHELGRFPYELPADLPGEQVELMFAYMQIVAEERRRTPRDQLRARARDADAELQRAEAEARRKKR